MLILVLACKPNFIPIFWVEKYPSCFILWHLPYPAGLNAFLWLALALPMKQNNPGYLIYENWSSIYICGFPMYPCSCFAIFNLLFALGLCLTSSVKFSSNVFGTEYADLPSTAARRAKWAKWFEWLTQKTWVIESRIAFLVHFSKEPVVSVR